MKNDDIEEDLVSPLRQVIEPAGGAFFYSFYKGYLPAYVKQVFLILLLWNVSNPHTHRHKNKIRRLENLLKMK